MLRADYEFIVSDLSVNFFLAEMCS